MRSKLLLALLALLPFFTQSAQAKQPNILFIAIDDMNDWVGFLGGHPQAITPNMDRLAESGVNFTNAHTPSPACSPCRNALLFGIEPFNSGLYPFYTFRDDAEASAAVAGYTSLPHLFKKNGYNTYASGKIHHDHAWSYQGPRSQLEWTENNYATLQALPPLVYNEEIGYIRGKSRKMAFCPTKSPLEHHPDYVTATFGIEVLKRAHEQPFFLAVGLIKPHLPFVAPKQFFDLYPKQIEEPAIKADDLADLSWPARGNAKLNDDIDFRKNEAWNDVRRAYLACNSWTDHNVGRLLDALAESPYANNTIVVLWSDHGYHFGEKRSFRKFSLWEESTRVPIIIWDTRKPDTKENCEAPVSLINIYKTLAEAAGIEAPDYADGQSLQPWLDDPTKEKTTPALATWGRGNYTARTKDWRYTRYFDGSEELYHHAADPQEWTNLAARPEYSTTKKALAKFLPTNEAPLYPTGISLHNVVDADKPNLYGIQTTWKKAKKTLSPPIE